MSRRELLNIDHCYKISQSGCWEWTRSLTSNGYGHIRTGFKIERAHILMYRKHKGEIPKGLELHHKCENKICINPDHLEPVTHLYNIRVSKRTKISPAIATQIRLDSKNGLDTYDLKRKYNLSDTSVRRVLNNEIYRNL